VVEPFELLHRNDPEKSPALRAVIARFNEVSSWVSTQVLDLPSVKHQTKMIKKFIKILDVLIERNNFQSAGQIMSGILNSNVTRLKKAWAGLADHHAQNLKRIEAIMAPSQNYKQYRFVLAKVMEEKKPCVLYLPLFLRDLTFTEDGNPNKDEAGNTNLLKLFLVGKQLSWFRMLSTVPYEGIQIDLNVQKLLMDLRVLSDEDLHKLSVACEPSSPAARKSVALTPLSPDALRRAAAVSPEPAVEKEKEKEKLADGAEFLEYDKTLETLGLGFKGFSPGIVKHFSSPSGGTRSVRLSLQRSVTVTDIAE